MRSLTGGPRFVCTNCDGHGVRGVAPLQLRVSCALIRDLWVWQRQAGIKDPNFRGHAC